MTKFFFVFHDNVSVPTIIERVILMSHISNGSLLGIIINTILCWSTFLLNMWVNGSPWPRLQQQTTCCHLQINLPSQKSLPLMSCLISTKIHSNSTISRKLYSSLWKTNRWTHGHTCWNRLYFRPQNIIINVFSTLHEGCCIPQRKLLHTYLRSQRIQACKNILNITVSQL